MSAVDWTDPVVWAALFLVALVIILAAWDIRHGGNRR